MGPIARNLGTAARLPYRREQHSDPVQFFFQDRTTVLMSRLADQPFGVYLFQSRRIWNHLPATFHFLLPSQAYGRHYACLGFSPRRAKTILCHFIFAKPGRSAIDAASRGHESAPKGTISGLDCGGNHEVNCGKDLPTTVVKIFPQAA